MFSNNNIKLLILILAYAHAPIAHPQEESRYHVEALVFRHLQYDDEPPLRPTRASFAAARDLTGDQLLRADMLDLGACAPAPVPPFRPGMQPDPVPPEKQVTRVEARSDLMSDVWRRLRLGAHYRPEAFLAWTQLGEAPFPLLRIHNQELLETEVPRSELRATASPISWTCVGEGGEIEYSNDYVYSYNLNDGELAPLALPPPIPHYRLDGTVRLRRERFLHIDLDIAYRQSVFESPPELRVPYLLPGSVTSEGKPIGPPRFRVQWLRQSRQVRTERMEYFDSPWLGVLVRVRQSAIIDPQEAAGMDAG